MKKYAPSVIMLAVFETIAVTLWLTKGNVFYLVNFSYIGGAGRGRRTHRRRGARIALSGVGVKDITPSCAGGGSCSKTKGYYLFHRYKILKTLYKTAGHVVE